MTISISPILRWNTSVTRQLNEPVLISFGKKGDNGECIIPGFRPTDLLLIITADEDGTTTLKNDGDVPVILYNSNIDEENTLDYHSILPGDEVVLDNSYNDFSIPCFTGEKVAEVVVLRLFPQSGGKKLWIRIFHR